MDPDAAYKLLKRLLPDALNGDTDAAEELAEVVSNLDLWLMHGGFLPIAWRKAKVNA